MSSDWTIAVKEIASAGGNPWVLVLIVLIVTTPRIIREIAGLIKARAEAHKMLSPIGGTEPVSQPDALPSSVTPIAKRRTK